jgi:hypothetical protein
VNSSADITTEKANKIVNIFQNLKDKLKGLDDTSLLNLDNDIQKMKDFAKVVAEGDLKSEDFETALIGIKGVLGSISNSIRETASENLHADLKDIDNYIQQVENVIKKEEAWKQSKKDVQESNNGVRKSIE